MRSADLGEMFEDAKRAKQGETVVAGFKKRAFHCVICAVFAQQEWNNLGGLAGKTPIWGATCGNCHFTSYWHSYTNHDGTEVANLIYPSGGSAPMPHPDTPEDVRKDYLEARSIADRSPRGACGLLRVALENLMKDLGESGTDLNDAIGNLVKKGLDPGVQQALDALRVVGNNAVHPGELDLRDDAETAASLFDVLNFIIEQMITRPKKLTELYARLPDGAKEQIQRRDGGPAARAES
jgi:Domain of unknown function (DUF4145)